MNFSFLVRLAIDAAGRAVSVVLIIVLARYLGVSEFGRVAFGFSVVNILYMLTELGTGFLFVRELGSATAGAPDATASRTPPAAVLAVWRQFLGLRAFLIGVTLVVSLLLTPLVWKWDHPQIFVALAVWMVANSYVDFLVAACNGLQSFATSAWAIACHRVGVICGAAVPILTSGGAVDISIGMAAGGVLGALASSLIVSHRFSLPLSPRWEFPVWIKWIKTSLPLSAGSIMGATSPRMGMLLLPRLTGVREVGYYGAAQRVFEIGYMIANAFAMVVLPRLAQIRKESEERFSGELRKAAALLLALAGVWLAGGLLFSELLVRLLFGEEFLPTVPVLRTLFVAGTVMFVNYFLVTLMVLLHRLKRHFVNEAVTLAFSVIATYTLATTHGIAGAAWAAVATEVVLCVATLTSLTDLLRRPATVTPSRQ